VIELALRFRLCGLKPGEDLVDRVIGQLLGHDTGASKMVAPALMGMAGKINGSAQ
jgi:hypothetical protein